MWHVFEYELSVDGNWIADIEGRFEVLWDENCSDWGPGTIELRHLKYDATIGGGGQREWYAEPSLEDPIAQIILPEIREWISFRYRNEVKARAAEAKADLQAELADQRRGFHSD